MADDGKRTELVCCKVTERVALELNRAAAQEDCSLSQFLYTIIRRELWGRTLGVSKDDGERQD